MALRPNVTVSVVDNSFIVATGEDSGSHVSAIYNTGLSGDNLVDIFGVTLEKSNGYMTIESAGAWVSRLNGTTLYGGVSGSGPTGTWKTDWYSAYNYLLYGGLLRITNSLTNLYDENLVLDSVFTSNISTTQVSWVEAMCTQRTDLVGIVGVTYEGYTGGSVPSGLAGITGIYPISANSLSSSNIMLVGGEKVSLALSNTGVENYVDIPLASDVAGCFVRTDRETQRWFSPAGVRRGRVLNIIRLKKNPSATEQDNLYTAKINYMLGVPGSGTFLFGDITKEARDTSTLTRINVVRLINYIKKTVSRTAQSVLFELNDELTRSLFTNAAVGFLQNIQDGRGLYGFKVVCDASNNPAAIVDSNQFVADLYIKPTKSINYVKIVITNVNTDTVL
jgi:hypothetical protein